MLSEVSNLFERVSLSTKKYRFFKAKYKIYLHFVY